MNTNAHIENFFINNQPDSDVTVQEYRRKLHDVEEQDAILNPAYGNSLTVRELRSWLFELRNQDATVRSTISILFDIN